VVAAPAVPPNGAVAPAKPAAVASRAASPAPPPPAKTEPAKPAQPQLAAVETADPATACNRDEQRLEHLRANPVPEEIAKFQRELSCSRLRLQVQRLYESVATGPLAPAAPAGDAKVTVRQPPQSQPVAAEDACARDASRLARLRADPSIDAVKTFERELGCEQIRPQLQRLRESLGG
jgi:hypothetical protein